MFSKTDLDRGNLSSLNKDDFASCLKEVFPHKDRDNINQLCHAAETELQAQEIETLEYKNLFNKVCFC